MCTPKCSLASPQKAPLTRVLLSMGLPRLHFASFHSVSSVYYLYLMWNSNKYIFIEKMALPTGRVGQFLVLHSTAEQINEFPIWCLLRQNIYELYQSELNCVKELGLAKRCGPRRLFVERLVHSVMSSFHLRQNSQELFHVN